MTDLPQVEAEQEASGPTRQLSNGIHLPAIRLERHHIEPSPAASLNSTKEGFRSTDSQFTRGAFSARQRQLEEGPTWRDGSATHRPSRTKYCPGALGWLYREPDNDARRIDRWIKSCPAPERTLRQELRTPVATPRGTPREVFGERGKNLDSCLQQVGRFKPMDSAVLLAAKRRQDRLRELADSEAVNLKESQEEALQLAPEVSQTVQNEANLEPPETDPDPEPSAARFQGRSRGSCAMSSEPLPEFAGFSKLADQCQATHFDAAAQTKHISAFILDQAQSDEERAWMTFCWVSFHITLDGDDFDCKLPERILPLRVAGARSIAKLFADLCAELHLPVKVISGHMRSASSWPGDDICADSRNRHWWNVVYLAEEWVLVDCASAAANELGERPPHSRTFQPFFFGPLPEDLAFSHYPAEDRWQLMPQPLIYETFVGQVHARPEVFAASGFAFSPQSRPAGSITLGETNTGCVHLRAPSNLHLRACLSGESVRCFVAAEGSRRVKLKITVVGATGLRNADLGGADFGGKYDVSDPYCVCHIQGKEHISFKTEVCRNKLDPKWNHTFTLDDLEPGDELCFRVFDKDFITADDFLGEVSLSTGRFLIGGAFEGDVDLNKDGAMGSKLQLRIQPLYVQEVQSASPEGLSTTAIYFRAPKGQAEHRLEIYAGHTTKDSFRRICTFKVLASADPPDFTEPLFPKVFQGACRLCGLSFFEALPYGQHVLNSKNEVELHLNKNANAPQGLEVVADVDGDRTAALAHVYGDTIIIRAQAPEGDHVLNIWARRDKKNQFAPAVIYRLRVPEDCAEVNTGGFPQLQDAYRALGAILEAPLMASLPRGLQRIRLRLPQDLSNAKVTVTTGVGASREATSLPYHSDGTFEADVHLAPPEAILLCATSDEAPQQLLRWTVAVSSSSK